MGEERLPKQTLEYIPPEKKEDHQWILGISKVLLLHQISATYIEYFYAMYLD